MSWRGKPWDRALLAGFAELVQASSAQPVAALGGIVATNPKNAAHPTSTPRSAGPSPAPSYADPLPTWDEACEELTEPAHVVRFGGQVPVKSILGGTEEAGRHIGYLTKYLTKSVGQAAGLGEHATDRQRDHAHRLHAELRITPCSPPVLLLHAIAERQRWKAEYTAAQLATGDPPGICSATRDQAA